MGDRNPLELAKAEYGIRLAQLDKAMRAHVAASFKEAWREVPSPDSLVPRLLRRLDPDGEDAGPERASCLAEKVVRYVQNDLCAARRRLLRKGIKLVQDAQCDVNAATCAEQCGARVKHLAAELDDLYDECMDAWPVDTLVNSNVDYLLSHCGNN